MDWKTRIVADPAVLAGKPAIKGTRLSVQFLLDLLAQGWDEQKILANYPQLTAEDLQAMFAYTSECFKDEEFLSLKRI
jgi:uncharacterized protein (DUF433 family)